MTIRDFADEAYEIAVEHGWYENGVTLPEAIVSIHCEASEAFQEWRQGHLATETYTGADGKPEGVPSELADIVIRVFSFCLESTSKRRWRKSRHTTGQGHTATAAS